MIAEETVKQRDVMKRGDREKRKHLSACREGFPKPLMDLASYTNAENTRLNRMKYKYAGERINSTPFSFSLPFPSFVQSFILLTSKEPGLCSLLFLELSREQRGGREEKIEQIHVVRTVWEEFSSYCVTRAIPRMSLEEVILIHMCNVCSFN